MRKLAYTLLGVIVAFAALIFGCGDAANVSDPTDVDYYNLQGGIVKNLDNDTTQVAFTLTKDSVDYVTASLAIYDDTIAYDSVNRIYNLIYSGATEPDSGVDTLAISDSPNLNEKYAVTIPDDFYITNIALPTNRINAGGASVQLQWSASLLNDGYIIAVVLKDSLYQNNGYVDFVEGGFTSGTILPDAFRIYGDLTTGWYYVYIYSYAGSPASSYNLPTSLPEGFIDNIDELYLSGRFGAIVVSPRDSIYVDTR